MSVGSLVAAFKAGILHVAAGLVVGYLYQAFVPMILAAWSLPAWLSGIVLFALSVLGAASDLGAYHRSFCFTLGAGIMLWALGDYWGIAVCVLGLAVRWGLPGLLAL